MAKTNTTMRGLCNVFEEGCMYCASPKTPVFNPEKFPQKMHIAEMAYHCPQGSLFVRETTAEIEKQPGEEYTQKTELTIEVPTEEPNEEQMYNLKNLKQSCSGITFVEEKEEKEREAVYQANLKKMLAARKLWKQFTRQMEYTKKIQQLKGCGPQWFQELSTTQLSLLDSLPFILKADTDEKTTSNSRKFLVELGIVPMLDPKLLEKAVTDCELDPLYFLGRVQKEVRWMETKRVANQENEDKLTDFVIKRRKFSVSERILLSSICHIHLPLLLFKLHLILPPPKEDKSGKKDLHALSPLQEVDQLPEPKKEWYRSGEKKFPSDSSFLQEFENFSDKVEGVDDSKSGKAKFQYSAPQESPSIWTMMSIQPKREQGKSQYFGIDESETEFQDMQEITSTVLPSVPSLSNRKGLAQSENSFNDASQVVTISFCENFPNPESEFKFLPVDSFVQTDLSFNDNTTYTIKDHSKYVRPSEKDDKETEKVEKEVTELLSCLKDNKESCSKPPEKKVEKSMRTMAIQTELRWVPPGPTSELQELFGEEYLQDIIIKGSSIDRGANTSISGGKVQDADYEDIIATIMASFVRKPTEYEIQRKENIRKCLEQNNIDGLYSIFGLEPTKPIKKLSDDSETEKKKSKKPKKVVSKSNQSSKRGSKPTISSPHEQSKQSNLESKCAPSSQSNFQPTVITESDLEKLIGNVREEVMKHPAADRLKYSLWVTAHAGDPLAQFPDIYKCPTIVRWYEIRTGKKRRLTEKEKVDFMNKSRRAWGFMMNTLSLVKIPRCTLSAQQLADFTWDKKMWITKQVKKVSSDYQRGLRQALVDDARCLYSTMYGTHYESKLNKNIRKVFFTYLPSAENDCYVYKPFRAEDVKRKE